MILGIVAAERGRSRVLGGAGAILGLIVLVVHIVEVVMLAASTLAGFG